MYTTVKIVMYLDGTGLFLLYFNMLYYICECDMYVYVYYLLLISYASYKFYMTKCFILMNLSKYRYN